jgi:zinc transport system permease protein
MADFVLRALLAGLGVALVSGALGCFLVWRRMAYFGATLAHSALLGVALGLLFEIDPNLGILAVCVAVSALLVGLQARGGLATDTLLGILAHGTLAFGLVAISFMETLRIDLMAYLFGDILAVTPGDLLWIYLGGLAVLAGLVALWRPLLLITVHEELARVDGIPTGPVKLAFMLLISAVIAIAMKIVGVLLIISMLIIPAAAARRLAATPEQMALFASGLGCLAVAGGLGSSMAWDTPAGPSIVVVATGLFFLLLLLPRRQPGGGPVRSDTE